MSNDIYPTLPGLTFSVTRTVLAPAVQILTTPSEREYRARDAVTPRYQYMLPYEFLRSSSLYLELQQLVGFFNAHGGSFDTFLFTDPDDCVATAMLFGNGDGTTRVWQLVRAFGGFAEPVYDFNGGMSIFVNGSAASGFSVSSSGLVTFTTAPTAGAVLTWTGAYYRRVRFLTDKFETSKFLQYFFDAKRVELISTKA